MARLHTAVLCNAATVEQSGLVSMLGAFVDTLYSAQPPARYMLWLVVRLLLDESDEGVQHELDVVVEAVELDDGSPLPAGPQVRIGGMLEAIERMPGADPRVMGGAPLLLPLPVELPAAGLYHVALRLNGDLLWDAPLLAKIG